jgi:hypothetical protein
MKKDLRKIAQDRMSTAVLSLMVLGFSAGAYAGGTSKDGSPVAMNTFTANEIAATDGETKMTSGASGQALLTLEDLKTLLGTKARDPSSSNIRLAQEEPSGGNSFKMQVSRAEVRRLSTQIQKIETARNDLVAKLEKQRFEKRAKIRAKRRDIQSSRLGAKAQTDNELAKSLYENILEESNIDARQTQALRKFDDDNSVRLDFIELNGTRQVESIRIGENKVWTQKLPVTSFARNP